MNRILICANVYPPHFIGGAELIAHYQAALLKKRGFAVAVFAGDANISGNRHAMVLEQFEGIQVYRVKLVSEDYQAEHTNFFHAEIEQQFVKVLQEFRPDLLHAHNLIGLSLGILHIARARGIRTVVTLHDFWGFCHKNTLIKRANEICIDHTKCSECMPYVGTNGNKFPIEMRQSYVALQLKDVDAFISPSRYLADRYIQAGFPASRMNVIWNGVDVERFSSVRKSVGDGRTRFTFIGHFGGHKGLATLLAAIPRIDTSYPFFLNLVGDGELRPSVEARIRSMGFESSCKSWGKVENRRIEEVFRQTDVQLLPSIWPENQPVSITEAMATRTPVIASRIGGIPELVTHGFNGYLFDAGDSAGLAEMMNRIMSDPADIKALGENGFQRISNKSFDAQIDEILTVYEGKCSASNVSVSDAEDLILCAGASLYAGCAEAIANLSEKDANANLRFVNAEWLAEDQFSKARLLWITGTEFSHSTVQRALRASVPVLVPEENPELLKLCRAKQCGLYYRGAAEAQEAIRYLFENRNVLAALSANAGALHGAYTNATIAMETRH